MAVTPEGKVKTAIKKILKNSGAYFAMPSTGGYGSSGTPDFLVCYKGKFIGIEAKTRGNLPTLLQTKNLVEIEYAGGLAIVINEDNIDQLERIFSE
jgi:hypothetical protein